MRKSKCGTRRTILKGKKINVNQILLFKLWYIGQFYTISNASKRKFKKYMIWSRTGKKMQPCRHLAQLSIWIGGLCTLESQSNSLKIKWILRLLIPTNTLWKHLMLY